MKNNVLQYGLSDEENVLPSSKKNSQEEYVEKGKKMVSNHIVTHTPYLMIFIVIKTCKIIEGANIYFFLYKQHQLEFHFCILCLRENMFYNKFFVN